MSHIPLKRYLSLQYSENVWKVSRKLPRRIISLKVSYSEHNLHYKK